MNLMESPLPLLIAGLLVAILAALALWSWRRLARTTSLETGVSATAAASRTPGARLVGDNEDTDKGSIRSGASAPKMLGGIRATGRGGGPEATGAPRQPPTEGDAPEEHTERPESGIAVSRPSQPCTAEDTADGTAPAIPVDGDDGKDSTEPEPPSASGDDSLTQTPDDDAPPEPDGGIKLPANAGPDQQNTSPSQDSPNTAYGPANEGAAAVDATSNPVEDSLINDPLDADQLEPASGTDAEVNVPEPTIPPSDAPEETRPASPVDSESQSDPAPILEPGTELPGSSTRARPKRPTGHRDRRGSRRTPPTATAPAEAVRAAPAPAARPPAEAKLRLSLHPIRRTARLSVVMTRPDGFPERVTVQAAVEHIVDAYDEQRYDDLDLPWTDELLGSELHLASADGFQWLRSARQVHIFSEDPNEPGLISVSAVRPNVAHTLVCRSNDAEAIHSVVALAGSPNLQTHEHWQGIPHGWVVLSGYTPVHAALALLPPSLRPLDPGAGLEIGFEGGLAIRPRVYAARHPPQISINPAPGSASVTIGGEPATLSTDGTWVAPGWDAPGQHMVDIVPGPSASYEIAADPWMAGGWDFWDAHPGRFGNAVRGPWARAEICGAQIRGPAGETVFAAEAQPTLIALGAKRGATPLQRRSDVSVSVDFMAEPPAFLLSATGQRRTQGRVIWLGLAPASQASRRHDPEWVVAVRAAASRRLPLERSDALGEEAWRKAKERARRLRRRRA